MAMPTWGKWLIGCGCATALVVALAIGAGVAWVNSRPRTWTVEESLEIAATPEEVYSYVAELQRWPEWSAWARDASPEVQREYSGAPAGAGAKVSWSGSSRTIHIGRRGTNVRIGNGNDGVEGAGELEIERASVDQGLDFRATHEQGLVIQKSDDRPSATETRSISIDDGRDYVIRGELRLEAVEGGTRVVWREHGDLGDGLAAGMMAVGLVPALEETHADIVRASLERLKEHIEDDK